MFTRPADDRYRARCGFQRGVIDASVVSKVLQTGSPGNFTLISCWQKWRLDLSTYQKKNPPQLGGIRGDLIEHMVIHFSSMVIIPTTAESSQ